VALGVGDQQQQQTKGFFGVSWTFFWVVSCRLSWRMDGYVHKKKPVYRLCTVTRQ
jgi:hypothetical protein